MAINFRGYLFDDSGNAIQGATVQLLEQDGDQEASTTTDSDGLWYFNESDEDNYDVKITRGSSIRYIQWDDQISIKELDVRNSTGNTTPAATFTNTTNNASNQVANFRSLNTTRADGDEIYLSFTLADDGGNAHEFARITGEAVDVSNGNEDGQIRFGVSVGGTMTDVFTINSTIAGSTDMTLDVSGDLVLDADGGDVFFKDGGTTFGSATNNSGNLIIKSGTTTALTFSGANLTAAGTIGSGAITSTGIVTGTGFTAGSAVLAEAELELLDGLTAGTAIASKVVTTDANIDTSGQRNLTITGELDAATLDISGNADIDGTLEADAITINGTAIGSIYGVVAGSSSIVTTGALDSGSITSGFGNIDSGSSTITTTGAVDFGAATVDSLDVSEGNITNVGNIALDTISSDGSSIAFGVAGTGEDVYFYSATSGDHMLWDASDEKLVIIGTDGANALEVTDGNVAITDNLTVSGNFTVSGTTTTIDTTNLTVTDPLIKLAQGTTASPANDLGIIFTRGNGSSTNIANRAILWDESADEFAFAFTNDEAGTTTGNVDVDDYADIHAGKITTDDALVIGTVAAAGTDTDKFLVLDSSGNVDYRTGTEVLSDIGGTGATAADDIGTGDGAVNLVTTSGNITIDAQANDADVIIKVDDNGSSVTAVTFDGSDEGNAIFVNDIQLKSDSAVLKFGTDLDTTLTHTDGTGLTLNSTNKLTFGDTGTFIHQSSDGVLTIESDTTVDINGAVVLNGAITGATNITLSGELDAATLDISGNADIDGTLETDNLTVGGSQGSDGQVLTSTGSGVAWEDAGGGGAWALVHSVTASDDDADIQFTSSHFDASTYDHYVFFFQNIVGKDDDTHFIARVSTDGGSNYDDGTSGNNYRRAGNSDSSYAYVVSSTGNQSNELAYGEFWVYAPHATTYTFMRTTGGNIDRNGNVYPTGGSGGHTGSETVHRAAADVDGIQFKFLSGNIVSGLIRMYGLKKA